MPHRFPFASSHSNVPEEDMQDSVHHATQNDPSRKRSASVLRRLHRIGDWLRRDDEHAQLQSQQELDLFEEKQDSGYHHTRPSKIEDEPTPQDHVATARSRGNSLLGRTLSNSKRVVPELPRQFTFKRQNSEKRDRLLAVEPSTWERRAVSAERRPQAMGSKRRQSSPLSRTPLRSEPDIKSLTRIRSASAGDRASTDFDAESYMPDNILHHLLLPEAPPFSHILREHVEVDKLDDRELQAELEARWILNLSMHFRDKSDREKFFVTYAQEPNRWRRVTVSCDYRDAPPDSLEFDLKSLHYQRDKSQRIYEAIRESLPEIQFYDTVTNLKLETEEGQLHVHVTEDVNEIVPYPSTSLVDHIQCHRYHESELDFQSHLSGFVYKVSVDNRVFVKKEIPGPDTVDEFLYEINALDSLQDSGSVIGFHGLVVDDEDKLVKGLLISFAPYGALVDMIYDYKTTDSLPWYRRERWAYQIIQGLSEIHEAGFVQGDFTLSNIVIDDEDDAKIIDINRRGCPIGWEPPELLRLIRSGQRISMCIGVKSDLFQLGMVLWALAQKHDEPEHVDRTPEGLPHITDPDVPDWFKGIVDMCVSQNPRDRPSARHLLSIFPLEAPDYKHRRLSLDASDNSFISRHSHREFIDPATTVDRNDIEEFKRGQGHSKPSAPSYPTTDLYPFVNPATSTGYRLDSNGSYILPHHRGRSPYAFHRSAGARSTASSTTSLSLSQGVPQWEHIYPDGRSDCGDDAFPPYRDIRFEQPRSSAHDGPSSRRSDHGEPPDAARLVEDIRTHALHQGESSQRATAQQNLLRAPLHQDSGFDEYMIEALERGQGIALPQHTGAPIHNLPPILTTTAEVIEGRDLEDSSSAHQSRFLMSPMELTQDMPTPQSPPTPMTPFSYQPSNTTQLKASKDEQTTDSYLDPAQSNPQRPDSKYSPDPTQQ